MGSRRALTLTRVFPMTTLPHAVWSFCRASALATGLMMFAMHAAESGPASNMRVTTEVAFLASGRTEKLDVYEPATRAPGVRSPAVVWIHGGGWVGGTKNEARAKQVCTTLVNAGYVALSIDYKLGDGSWPQSLHDCKNAVRYLRANAAKYGIDPERIAVAGGSAGGHLSLMVGLTAGKAEFEPTGAATPYPGVSSAVRCVINLYGITDLVTTGEVDAKGAPTATRTLMEKSLKAFNAANTSDAVLRNASPVHHVTKTSVPILSLHGDSDPTVDHAQSEKLAKVLTQHGVPNELVVLPGIGHTFDLASWQQKPLPRDLRPVALAFLEKHLGAAGKK